MNLLIDTHVLLWWFDKNPTLSKKAKTAIAKGENLVFVSATTAWEITIKKTLGKLEAPDNLEDELLRHNFRQLSVTIPHALAVEKLPEHHRDPFDRMLVAQSLMEGLTLVTRDSNLKKYDVPIILA